MKLAPGPRGRELVAAFTARRRDPVAALVALHARYGDVVRVRIGDMRQFIIADLDGAKHVLVDNNRNYTKGPGYALLASIVGRGLITSEGDEWKRHRRMVQPSMHQDRMRGFFAAMVAEAEAEARRYERDAASGAVVDVFDRMMSLALRIIARTMLGGGIDGREHDIHAAFTEILEHIERLSTSRLIVLEILPGGKHLRGLRAWLSSLPGRHQRDFVNAIHVLDEIIGGVIAERRRQADSTEEGSDLVAMLLRARDDQGVALTDAELRDEVMTMFLAGHETTATGLSWALYLLSLHPHYQDLIATEACRPERREESARRPERSEGELPSPSAAPDLSRLETARRVFEESLRLYPPVWRISRVAIADDVIAGYDVPAGSIVVVSPYLAQRDPRFWTQPEDFDPDRFAPGAGEGRPRLAHMPFGAGPRMCLGASFATSEAQIILSALCRAVVFEPVLHAPPNFEARVTLRPAGGMPLRIKQRPKQPAAESVA